MLATDAAMARAFAEGGADALPQVEAFVEYLDEKRGEEFEP